MTEDARGGLLACSSGLYHYTGGRFLRFGRGTGLTTDFVNSALDTGPTGLWVATAQGLSRYQGDVWTTFSTADGLRGLHTIALHQDSTGKLWIGGYGGVQIFDPQTLKFLTNLAPHASSSNHVEAIHSDSKGDVWVLYLLKGPLGRLAQFRDGNWREIPSGFTNVDGKTLVASPVQAMKFWQPSERWRIWEWMEPVSGNLWLPIPPRDQVLSLCEDREGNLWVGTRDNGLFCFESSVDPVDHGPPLVKIEEVLANHKSVFSKFRRNALVETGHPHQDDKDSNPSVGDYAENREVIVLPPASSRRLEFRFAAEDSLLPGKVRFKYRLDGFDRDWIDAGSEGVARYANLPPGSYRFRVTAYNTRRVSSQSEANFTFAVAPFLYQRWWSRLASGFGAAGIVAFAYLWRVSSLRQKQQAEKLAALAAERARISKDLHDGLGADLTRLSYLADKLRGAAAGEAEEQIQKLSRSTREMASALKDIIWAANPADETLQGLTARICEQAEDLLSAAAIRCRFDLPEALPRQSLPAEHWRNFLLAAKEALNNAARHSLASEVRIRAMAFDSIFQLSIEDNGRGFDPARPRAGNGLPNMKARVESAGGQFLVESEPGKGTRVRIRISLKDACKSV